jgi:hypothetical protein
VQIQIKMTEEIDDEIGLRKQIIFTTLKDDSITVRIIDEDTSEDIEINVPKSDLIKALNALNVVV